MAGAQPRPSLKQLAKECGLSVAAVSMALRGHPRISTATVERVKARAAKMGYRANPLLHSVMSHVRSANVRRMWLNVAFVWLDATPKSVRTDEFQLRTIRSVQSRADQLGLHLQSFFLSEPGMNPQRLEQIFIARAVSGLIFSPSAYIANVDLPFHWDKFSVVVMGNVPWQQSFHRSGHHHYHGMCRALAEVERLGYTRPGIVVKDNLNERAERSPEAAFLTHHPAPDKARTLIFRVGADNRASGFKTWLAEKKPDCLLFPFADAYPPFRDIVSKERYPYALLDQVVPGDAAGVMYEFDAIGSNAVDLLTTQILHNERGIPNRAQFVLAEGLWHDGRSMPPKGTSAASNG